MTEAISETVRLLVVSCESAVLRPLWSIPEANSWHIEIVVSAWDAIERVQSGVAPHLLLLDLPRGDGDSLHVLRWLRRLRPDLPVIVICFPEDVGQKKEAIRLGAQEVLTRSIDEAGLGSAIRRYLAAPEIRQADISSEDIEQLGPDSFFLSGSPITRELRARAELLAEADVPVLILGEPGSGKDTIAKLIHKLSVRSGFNFLRVSCADMPAELLETELFGNEQTGSLGDGLANKGKFERAQRGTLFLDEVAEMPNGLQSKLVHILQEKTLLALDNDQAVPADVRILAATTANIEQALAEGKLREDLYYRLSAFTIQVPPLRQRRSEIAVLLQLFMNKLVRHYGLPPREFPSTVLDKCRRYSWPGNLKELEAFVKRYLLAGDHDLTSTEFNPSLAEIPDRAHILEAKDHETQRHGSVDGEGDRSSVTSLRSLIQIAKSEMERNAIGTALRKTGWNRKAAARLLRVSYRTLLYKIAQYHMNSSEHCLSPLPAGQNSGTETKGKAN